MNDLQLQPDFDFNQVTSLQARSLKAISIRLQVHAEQAATAIIEIGKDLLDAKRELKENGEAFKAWCNSVECPIGNYDQCKRYMSITNFLEKKGCTGTPSKLYDLPFSILARITQTQQEEVQKALIAHVEETAGNPTKDEIVALKKAMNALKVENLTAKDLLAKAREQLESEQAENERKQEVIRKATEAGIAASREKKALLNDLETKRKMLKEKDTERFEAIQKAREEMKSRPLDTEEKQSLQTELKELRKQKREITSELENVRAEKLKVKSELASMERERAEQRKIIRAYVDGVVRAEKDWFLIASAIKGGIVDPQTYGSLVELRDTFTRHIAEIDKALATTGDVIDVG